MQQMSSATPRLQRRLSLVCAATAALLVGGCGGGGFEVLVNGSGISASTASTYTANATLVASDTATALDEAVFAAREAATQVRGTVAAAVTGQGVATALAVTPSAIVNVPIDCAASGTALLSISGGTSSSILNGQFDATEVYQIVFSNCRGTANGAAVTGTLTLTVLNAGNGTLGTVLSASNLVVALPRGSITLNGDTTRQTVTTTGTGSNVGSMQFSSRFTAPRLTTATQFNGRNNSFTLTGLDLTRNSNWLNGALQSSTLTGSHTLAATLGGVSFTHTVSTDGSVGYSSTGLPISGRWVLNVPTARLGITVLNAVATVTVDQGSNGSIEDTYTFPVSRLQSDAG